MPMALTGDRSRLSRGVICLWRNVSTFSGVYSGAAKMFLPDVGRAGAAANRAISPCAVASGSLNIAIRRNTNAPIVRTVSLSHWAMSIFIGILKDETPIVGMLSDYMPSLRITDAISCALTLTIRVVSMVIKRMFGYICRYAAIGIFRHTWSGRVQAMALTFGYSSRMKSKPVMRGWSAMQSLLKL